MRNEQRFVWMLWDIPSMEECPCTSFWWSNNFSADYCRIYSGGYFQGIPVKARKVSIFPLPSSTTGSGQVAYPTSYARRAHNPESSCKACCHNQKKNTIHTDGVLFWLRRQDSICILPFDGQNRGSAPSSRHRRRSSAPHLDGFESCLFAK